MEIGDCAEHVVHNPHNRTAVVGQSVVITDDWFVFCRIVDLFLLYVGLDAIYLAFFLFGHSAGGCLHIHHVLEFRICLAVDKAVLALQPIVERRDCLSPVGYLVGIDVAVVVDGCHLLCLVLVEPCHVFIAQDTSGTDFNGREHMHLLCYAHELLFVVIVDLGLEEIALCSRQGPHLVRGKHSLGWREIAVDTYHTVLCLAFLLRHNLHRPVAIAVGQLE